MGKRDKEIPYEVVIQERKRVDLLREMFLTGWAKDDLKSFCSYVGDTWNDWLLRPVATRIYDLVSYYGAEEIFGNSYRTYTAKEVCLSLHIKYMEEYETAC